MASPKKTIFILLGMAVTAIAGISAVFAVFVKLAETEFIPGEETYLRDVYVIIDQTLSMGQGQRKEAKEIVEEEILFPLGLGDRISCYRISSKFTETHDRVFTSSRFLPKIFNNLEGVTPEVFSENLKSELLKRWQMFSGERDSWLANLHNLSIPGGNFSDYIGALEEIGRRINHPENPGFAGGKWLIVIGDLKHEPILKSLPVALNGEKKYFSNVRIFMVYPGGIHPKAEQQRIEMFWNEYFAARGNREVSFISFDGFIGRFPANRVPKAENLVTGLK